MNGAPVRPSKPAATIDPRLHDAVVFDLIGLAAAGVTLDSTSPLTRKLAAAHVETMLCSQTDIGSSLTAAQDAHTTPERAVVVTSTAQRVQLASSCGYALVVGVHPPEYPADLEASGADVVVSDPIELAVRTGARRISELPDVVECYGQLIAAVDSRQPFVCLDFDGTLAHIVGDPAVARLVDGAAEALTELARHCPVAILSGRELSDIRERVGIPGLWYAGCHGFEISGPDGTEYRNEGAAQARPALRTASDALRRELAGLPGVVIEQKSYSVAVHYRNAEGPLAGRIIEVARRNARRLSLRVTTGRKLVELRPDIDWDKGKALTWILSRISGDHRNAPIYVGDDLTDEDAFDALRFSGIAVVVRNAESGDRPTSARFAVADPAEVPNLLLTGTRWLERRKCQWNSAWELRFDGYDPHSEKLREALCTVGNGYFATRGAAPESVAGQVHYPGTYVAGVYNRLEDTLAGANLDHESLVNLPNWLCLTFRIDGAEWFDVDSVQLTSYHQTLDIRSGLLTRELTFDDDAGRTTSVVQRRFVAMHQRHVAALETRITAKNWSGALEIRSTIDSNVSNCGVDRYRDLDSHHLESSQTSHLSENSVLLTVRTNQSQIPVALAARTTVWMDDDPAVATYRAVEGDFEVGQEIFVDVGEGQTVAVDKVVTLTTGRDVATSEPAAGAVRQLDRQGRFDEIRRGHSLAWAHIWERMWIELEGHHRELGILRLHMFHLLQTVSNHSEDSDVGVPARGLHGEAYRGHIFWDELFIFPVLNLRFPMITRALLRYRYRRLTEARRAARLAGYAGAMFPWQSGSDGREESPTMHLNPRSGRWNPDASRHAHHVGIAVAYNVWQFYQATGDLAYLIDYGAEMLVEIARFWVSRATYDAVRNRYDINGVIGPDEFHSGYPDRPFDGIDNNAYTNVMAVWVILRALDALEALPLPNRLDLRERLGVTDTELHEWDHVSRRMFVPFHDGMISQFEGYDRLSELDWDAYRERHGDLQRLDRILEAEGDDVNRYRASKQADALMLLYLLSSEELRELLHRLGYALAPAKIPEMVDYYLGRTSHGSTLSAVVHSWVLARANRDRAMDFFRAVLVSDVDDIQGGTTSEGIHLAAMAGSVDLLQRCFTGLETREDRLVLAPHWPESLGVLAFPVHYRGLHLHVRVSGRGAEVSVGQQNVPSVILECRGRVYDLVPGTVIRLPAE